MSLFNQILLLMCVLTLLSTHNSLGVNAYSSLFFQRMHVNVTNTLLGNLDLTLHCKSADDDLGKHILHHGQNWSFRNNFFGETQFYCGFRWNEELHWFDIYIANRDDCRTSCNWNILQSGPCRTIVPSDIVVPYKDECFAWNKNK
jgi:hypothetical protein